MLEIVSWTQSKTISATIVKPNKEVDRINAVNYFQKFNLLKRLIDIKTNKS